MRLVYRKFVLSSSIFEVHTRINKTDNYYLFIVEKFILNFGVKIFKLKRYFCAINFFFKLMLLYMACS